jgi:CSLREA domain-containing protein
MAHGGRRARRATPVLVAALIALVTLGLATASGTSAAVGTTFTVDSTADTADASIGDGVCADAAGSCTLRAAIAESNASDGSMDTIEFDIQTAPLSIASVTQLPTITDPVDIDGTTQTGFAGNPIVEVRGTGTVFHHGLVLNAGNSTVAGLVLNRFFDAIDVNSSDNRIEGNFIGTNIAGTAVLANERGIRVVSGSRNHVERNTISGNNAVGLEIDPASSENVIQGNHFGTNATGMDALPNGVLGDLLINSDNDLIGGTVAEARNLIARALFIGESSTGATVQGNYVGTDATGEKTLEPRGSFLEVRGSRATIGGTVGVTLGGPCTGACNVIASGLSLSSPIGEAGNHVVQGNFVGTDVSGMVALGAPGRVGVGIAHTSNNLIGGINPAERNLISGNDGAGVHIDNTNAFNRVVGNFIGTTASGTGPLPNGVGVVCCNFGGDNTIERNVIAFNRLGGVQISGFGQSLEGSVGNAILGNSIFSNGELGIDLGGIPGRNGVTENDAGDTDTGPNGHQNFPEITGVTVGQGSTIIEGRLDSIPSSSYHVELFRNTECDPSHFGEGETFLGSVDVPAGGSTFTVTYPLELSPTDVVTSTATDARNNTSEFSECLVVTERPATIIVRKATVPSPDPTDTSFGFSAGGGLTPASFSLKNGESRTFENLVPRAGYGVTETTPAGWDSTSACGDGSPVSNIDVGAGETVTCTFTNTKRGSVTLKKTTNGVVDPSKDISFVLTGPGLPTGGVTRSTSGDQDGVLEFGEANLTPGQTYKICEMPVPAGFTSFWKLDGTVVTPYNPDATRTPLEDLGVRCYDFSVAPAQGRAFEVDNSRPGGDPRTIGYWKNWNRCSGGNQAATAQKNGGAAAGFFLVEDLLPQLIGDVSVTTCQQAVELLSKQDQSGRNKAGDAAYELGAQLLAARFNLAAGAEICLAVQQAVLDGQSLLDQIGFTGSGDYLGSKSKDARRTWALSLAATVDSYNNGNLC